MHDYYKTKRMQIEVSLVKHANRSDTVIFNRIIFMSTCE